MSLTEKRKEELSALLTRCGIAGDTYYARMSDDVFAEAMSAVGIDRDDPLYLMFAEQRAHGVDVFAGKVAGELLAVTSSEELHFLASAYNYDSGVWLLGQIVAHPHCDATTALQIYWSLQPDYVYARYGSPAKVPADDFLAGAARVLFAVEERTRQRTFVAVLPTPDLGDFGQGEHDYASPPLSGIPAALRI